MDALWAALKVSKNAGYSTAAALTFMICDILSNFEDEIKYIWRSRWNFVKMLYIVSRYYSVIYVLAGTFFSGVILNVIFILRIYALYARSRRVLVIFVVLYLIELAFELYTISWTGKDVINNVIPPPVPMWHGCLTRVHDSRRTLLAWIPAIVGSFIFFVATMMRFKESITNPNGERVNILNDWSYVSPMIMVFFRDGAFYFIVITGMFVVNASWCKPHDFNPLSHNMRQVIRNNPQKRFLCEARFGMDVRDVLYGRLTHAAESPTYGREGNTNTDFYVGQIRDHCDGIWSSYRSVNRDGDIGA
ncbi:hypothetical protein MD484_g5190, partial [Candolleomyces efflorescens]